MNPYQTNAIMGTEEFLSTVYILMAKKVKRLIEIENSKKKNKLPLPLLKEKFEESSKILEALKELLKMIDYNNKDGVELADILNDIGILLGKGNVAETSDKALYNYNMCLIILDAFNKIPE